MKRRILLRGALAAGLAGPGLAALTHTRHELDAALSADHSTTDVGFWASTAERHSFGYSGQTPVDVLSSLLDDFADLRRSLSRAQTVQNRTALCHATGQMAGMAAIVLHDLGQHREAHRWFGTAARAAEQSGDRLLYAWVTAREAMVPLNYGAPEAAAQLAEKARHLAGEVPSAAGALAAAVASRAYAVTGDRDRALTSVAETETLAGRLSPQQRADTWFGYPMQKHFVHTSQALTVLGETERAYQAQARALELSRAPSLMTRALIAIDRASCRAQDGEPVEAARLAAEAYGGLPDTYRTGLTRTRTRALHRSLPPGTPGVDRLADALSTSV
ncbi:hypothetical protein [Streptomyces sp. NPDC059256]|uniref:hypothetical protein n=1 Tax=Streptomyces sp. NPDC059256 TaxID=3346794 RepID=UPI00369D1D5D